MDKAVQTKRPSAELTATDKLSVDEIKILLEDYKKVKDVNNILIGSCIRYFIRDTNGNLEFQLGGEVMSTKRLPTHLILRNGGYIWTIELLDKILFMKMSSDELKQEFNIVLKEKDEKIKQLIYLSKTLIEKNELLTKELEQLKKS